MIDTLSNLARTYEFQSRYVEAVDLRKRAVALGEGTVGRDKGVGLANSLNDLAMTSYLLGRYARRSRSTSARFRSARARWAAAIATSPSA